MTVEWMVITLSGLKMAKVQTRILYMRQVKMAKVQKGILRRLKEDSLGYSANLASRTPRRLMITTGVTGRDAGGASGAQQLAR